MSLRRDLAALRWRVIRNGPNDERGFSLVAGLVAAAGVLTVAVLARDGVVDRSWLTVALTVFGMTWFVGPILVPAASLILDPQWFRTLPRRPRRIAAAMAASEAMGVGSVITVAALTSLLVVAAPHGAIAASVGLVGIIAQLFFLLWLGRCVRAIIDLLLRSRIGEWPAAFQMSALLAVAFAGWVPIMAHVLPELGAGETTIVVPSMNIAVPQTIESALLFLPTGWGLAAVFAASAGGGVPGVVLPLFGLVIGGTLLRAAWISLTARALREPPARDQSHLRVRGVPVPRVIRRHTAVSAVTVRELKTWVRDPHRKLGLGHAWMTPLMMIFLVAPTNWSWALPFIGVMAAVLGAMVAVNTYSLDGTALWQLITTPGALSADVRGRQLAWLILIGGPLIAGTVVLCIISHSPFWAVALGMTLTATGTACAAAPLMSVVMPSPGRDARERVSSVQSAGNSAGAEWTVFAVVATVTAGAAALTQVLILPGIAGVFGVHGTGDTVVVALTHLLIGALFGLVALVLLSAVLRGHLERAAPTLLSAFVSKDITRLRAPKPANRGKQRR